MKPFPASLLTFNLAVAAPLWAQDAPVAPTPAVRAESLTALIRKGDLAAVKVAIEADAKLLSGTGRSQSPLYTAIQSGKSDIVAYLLEKGADPNAEIYSYSPLATAIASYNDNWKPVAELLLAKGAKIEATDTEGQSILTRTLGNGGSAQKEKIAWLLSKGADINARNRYGKTALETALAGSSSEVVALILDKADVKKADENGNTPLFTAVTRGNVEYVRLLIDKGADVNAQNAGGDTVLHLAAQNPSTMIKTLLDAGAKANLKNSRGDLPLHIALRRRDENAAGRIYFGGEYRGSSEESAIPRGVTIAPLTDKSEVNSRDQFGLSPLLLAILARDQESRDLIAERAPKMDATTQLFDAAAQGNLPVLGDLLTKKPYLVYFRLADGTTPLHVSALWGTLGAAQLLVKKGADVNARDSRGEAPLHETLARPTGLFARRAKNMEAFLLEKGASVGALDGNDTSPLARAVKAGEMELIAPLLAKNADVNTRDRGGITPIFALMTKESDLKLVSLLIDKGASLNLRPTAGASLLSRAVQTRRKELVQLLLDKGADANTKDSENRTPLAALIYNGGNDNTAEIAAILLAKGANPNERVYGDTMLSRAVSNDSKELVRVLLATKRVDLKATGEGRQSPLYQAVNYNRVEIAAMLLEAGANAKETDERGRPLAEVAATKSKEMAEVFAAKTKTPEVVKAG